MTRRFIRQNHQYFTMLSVAETSHIFVEYVKNDKLTAFRLCSWDSSTENSKEVLPQKVGLLRKPTFCGNTSSTENSKEVLPQKVGLRSKILTHLVSLIMTNRKSFYQRKGIPQIKIYISKEVNTWTKFSA